MIRFFSFLFLSSALLSRPRIPPAPAAAPPFLAKLACLRSNRSDKTFCFFFSARRASRSGSIALIFLRSSGSSFASASASFAWCSDAEVDAHARSGRAAPRSGRPDEVLAL